MKLTFSPALAEDVQTLYLLNKELIDQYEDISSIDYDFVLGWVRNNMEQNLSNFFRVFRQGELAGFYCLTGSDGAMELDSLFVLPPFQNQGIGTAILEHCKGISSSLLLYVFRKNTGAIRLYRKMGFQITEEVGKTRYIMTWKNQGC